MKKIISFFIAVFLSFSLIAQSLSKANLAALSGAGTSEENLNGPTSLTPNPVLAMSSSDYPVTAGDVYTLAFAAGTTPVSYSVTVDASYKFRVANLAVINVSGLTFLQLKKQVEDIVSKNYPMSGVQFALISPALFQVTVKGEVKETVIKQAWALTRLSSLVKENLTQYASLNNITITSASGKQRTYDLFKAQRFGDLSQDPYLRPGDVITFNKIDRVVSVSGAVERPGRYELKKGENLKSLFDYYGGGFTDYADKTRIEIVRLNKQDLKNKVIYLNEKNYEEDFVLEDNDSVTIISSTDLRPVMFIEGAISQNKVQADAEGKSVPAEMDKLPIRFNPDTNYATLLRSLEGYFLSTADLANSYIIRGDRIIPINVTKLLYDRSFYSEEVVMPYDVLRIPFKLYYVTVSGAVNKPGRYPYIPDRNWDYYIGLAGGFDESKNKKEKVQIIDVNGKVLDKKAEITPETTIKALANNASYNMNQNVTPWLQIISTFVSTIALVLSLIM